MKKIKIIILILIGLSFSISFNGNASDKIIVVTELSPPYQTINDNHIGGFATDKMKQYLESKNINYDIQMYPWARAYKLATSKTDMMIYGIAKTPKREKIFDWLIPVYEFKPYLVGLGHRTDLNIRNLEQAKSFTIAVQRNDFSHDYLLEKGFIENKNIILTNSIVDSWRLVKNGKVDFIVEDITYVPTINGEKIELNLFAKYFPLDDLESVAYLAVNKSMSKELKSKLFPAVIDKSK